MASGMFNKALKEILDGTIDLDSNTLKVMLVKSTFSYDPDLDVVDNGANDGTDPSFCELVATNYTGGFAGAGRKTATITVGENDTNNRGDVAIADLTWSALGGATNDTIAGLILIKEVTNDTLSRLICFFDLTTDIPTNGSDITFDFNALASGGNIRFSA